MEDLSKKSYLKHIRNLYFCYREIGTTLEYSIIANVEEKDKSVVYQKEKEGFSVVKILANE